MGGDVMVAGLSSLDSIDLRDKTVLVRVDLNVPMQGGKVTDNTRILRLLPTLEYLLKKNCRIILLSHFDRPKGKFVPSMSLAPLVDAVSEALGGKEVKFGVDCVGTAAREAVSRLGKGEVLLLENLRFHPQEEAGDNNFAHELASLGEVFINDAFSASHRAHASIVGLAKLLPTVAGKLMEQELEALDTMFAKAQKPIAAIVGGSKVSTKLDLLENLSKTMDKILIGGAMANVFLQAQGHSIGKSLCESGMKKTALSLLKNAEKNNCKIVLPVDLMVAKKFALHAPNRVVPIDAIPDELTAVDIGPESVRLFVDELRECKTIVWNGPVGAFETSPFDTSTVSIARSIAALTASGKCKSIAGGGDTVSALMHSGVMDSFSYFSTAGGAFLEWLEGKTLPGVVALLKAA
jgi:phosphoglycerate kinase